MIADTRLNSKAYVYSCVNFILLKEIVETISGIRMDEFLNKEFFVPMKLSSMTHLPLRTHNKDEIAPTLKEIFLRNGIVQGYARSRCRFFGWRIGQCRIICFCPRCGNSVSNAPLNKGEPMGNATLVRKPATFLQLLPTK